MIKLTTCLAGIMAASQLAQADDIQGVRESYASALLGMGVETSSKSSGSSGTNFFTYSGRVGTSLFGDSSGALSLGLYVGRASNNDSIGTLTASSGFTVIAVELLTRHAFGTGLYFGARIGMALDQLSVTNTQTQASLSSSATSFVFGPAAGYEFWIAPTVNLDLDMSWITVGGTTFSFPTVGSIQTNSFTAFVFQGGVTFHW